MQPAHDQLLVLAALFHAALLVHFEDVADRFLFGRVDERARVDDHHVRFVRIGDNGHPGLVQRADHDLGVDEVLGTTEGNEADFDHGSRSGLGSKTAPQMRGRSLKGSLKNALLFLGGGLGARVLALEVGGAAFAFDVLVELLAHGDW
jgi:hypothetical protein